MDMSPNYTLHLQVRNGHVITNAVAKLYSLSAGERRICCLT